MIGGQTRCELSVDDQKQQSEQDDGVTKNSHVDSHTWDENWVQNEMTDGHKVELTDGHKSWKTECGTHWIQSKLPGGRNICTRSWQNDCRVR